MFHLAAYTGSLVLNTETNMSGLVDAALTRSATSSVYVLQKRMMLLAGVFMSVGMVRGRLQSPSLRQINPPYLHPIIRAAIPASNSQVAWFIDQPLLLPALEEITPSAVSNTNPGPETGFCLLWLAEQVRPIPPGDILTCRATATFAATANVWTLGSFTLETALPSGAYALVGSEHISATAIAHRFQIPSQVYRPGNLSHQANADLQDVRLQSRRLGNYGNFLNTAPPQLEVLCTGADASHEIYLQLVKIGDNMAM
jgi:hypothetical protein